MKVLSAALLALALCISTVVTAPAATDKLLQNERGTVSYQSGAGSPKPLAPKASIALADNDYAITGATPSLAALSLPDSSRVLIGPQTKVQLAFFSRQPNITTAKFILYNGETRFIVQHPAGAKANYTFQTTTGQIAVRGTEGDISLSSTQLQVAVYQLTDPNLPVQVALNNGKTYELHAGQVLTVTIAGAIVAAAAVAAVSHSVIASSTATFGSAPGTVAGAAGAAAAGIPAAAIAGAAGAAAAGIAAGLSSSHSTPSPKPTRSPTPPPTPTPSPKPTATPTATPSPTSSPSPTPTASPSPSPTPTASPSPSPSPTATPTASPSPVPTATIPVCIYGAPGFGPPHARGRLLARVPFPAASATCPPSAAPVIPPRPIAPPPKAYPLGPPTPFPVQNPRGGIPSKPGLPPQPGQPQPPFVQPPPPVAFTGREEVKPVE